MLLGMANRHHLSPVERLLERTLVRFVCPLVRPLRRPLYRARRPLLRRKRLGSTHAGDALSLSAVDGLLDLLDMPAVWALQLRARGQHRVLDEFQRQLEEVLQQAALEPIVLTAEGAEALDRMLATDHEPTPALVALMRGLPPVLAVLALTACVTPPPLAALPSEDPWTVAAHQLAEDWELHPTLPTLETPLCRRYVGQVRVVHTTEQEFADHTGFCPMTRSGCSTMGGCPGTRCVTGSVIITGGDVPTIFLSPEENADGHVATVRHEMAHVLSACTTGAFDSGHRDARVWGGSCGVVWRGAAECRKVQR